MDRQFNVLKKNKNTEQWYTKHYIETKQWYTKHYIETKQLYTIHYIENKTMVYKTLHRKQNNGIQNTA
jgi:hypothetical protein